MIDLLIATAALLLFAALVGVAVRFWLVARAAPTTDDVLAARAARASAASFFSSTRKRTDRLRAELPDALDMVANSLSAGLTLPQALLRNLDNFPPHIADEFAHVLYDTRLGYSTGQAFDNFAARLPSSDFRMVAIASKIGVAHGGNLADSYRMLSALVRDNLAFENELRAMTTEGRMQAIVMSCLPFALLLILLLIQPEVVSCLFTTVAGWITLFVMTGMQLAAYFWIRKIVDIRV